MNIINIIEKKVAGKNLSQQEIEFFVNGYTNGQIPDYQMSSLLMAIVCRGMDEQETFHLTQAMLQSGDTVDLSSIDGITCDKHSTGGVGDSTTIAVAPILACCGFKVAKLSGRGLGFTGGTLDKLESIPYFNVNLDQDNFCAIVNHVGCCVAGQTANIVPADKKMYALRDITGTTKSLPLMVSSIMSKKLASGAQNILLDVKYGTGAYMKTMDEAIQLAEAMVKIGTLAKRNIGALITDMSQPLSRYVGNALEIVGIIEMLNGKKSRLYEENKAVATRLMQLCGVDLGKAEKMFDQAISSGQAKNKLIEMVYAQGGQASYIEHPERFSLGQQLDVVALRDGYVGQMETCDIGYAVNILGGGRMQKDDQLDHGVGIKMQVDLGDKVKKGDVLATIYHRDKNVEQAKQLLEKSIFITDSKPLSTKTIHAYVDKNGVTML
ncbi:MAG: thymidine phosphorylase [Clostridia bacterium]|nr:thymidine phosphorylase [Clostridia bacterium]